MKITKYEVDIEDVYYGCEDVPSYLCVDIACSDCPFNVGDISGYDLIKDLMEKYNAGN